MSFSNFIFQNNNVRIKPSNRKRPILQYLVFFIFIYFTVDGVSHVEALDLGRYIEEAYLSANKSWYDIFKERFAERVDFIYFIIIATAAKTGLSLSLLTAIIVFVYYCLIIKSIQNLYPCRIDNHVLICLLLTAPILWITSISRNLTAIMFMYCAVYFFYKRKLLPMLIFLVIGIFTHFTLLMWVISFVASIFLQKFKLKTKYIILLLTVLFILGYYMPMQIQFWMMQLFQGEDLRYSYYDFEEAKTIFSNDYAISLGDRLSSVFAVVYSIILMLYNKKQGVELWNLVILTVLLAYFLNSNLVFANRIIIYMPLFWGLNVASIYSTSPQYINVIKKISWVGILFALLNIYTSRYIYYMI